MVPHRLRPARPSHLRRPFLYVTSAVYLLNQETPYASGSHIQMSESCVTSSCENVHKAFEQ